MLRVLFLLLCISTNVLSYQADDVEVYTLSKEQFLSEDGQVILFSGWYFNDNESAVYSVPTTSDSNWVKISSTLNDMHLTEPGGIKTGWYQFRFKVDSTLLNYPISFFYEEHNGASQIYLNGKQLSTLGEIASFTSSFKAESNKNAIPFIVSDTTENILSIRYSNPKAEAFSKLGKPPGFLISVMDMSTYVEKHSANKEMISFFLGAILLIFVIHLFLFAANTSEIQNLHITLISISLALFLFSSNAELYVSDPFIVTFLSVFSSTTWLVFICFSLRYFYSLHYSKTPYYFWVILLFCALLFVFEFYSIQRLLLLNAILIFIILFELLRVLAISNIEKKSFLVLSVVALFFINLLDFPFSDIPRNGLLTGNTTGLFLFLVFLVLYSSKRLTEARKKLENKILEVNFLSERALKQERVKREKEIETRILEIENQRKTSELDEARKLQLSMLPKEMPENEFFDITSFMETAQEVGGDYYDFRLSENGTLNIALGDATGHGMKAGILVATTKSYFQTISDLENKNVAILKKISSGIRNMSLRFMFMGLTLVSIKKHSLLLTSAGMPPSLLFRKKEGDIEEIIIKSMPLGSVVDFPYEEKSFDMNKGDVLLLMSDGLIELFNQKREQLGMERVKTVLKENANLTPEDISHKITGLMKQWLGDKKTEDDVTFMILKAK